MAIASQVYIFDHKYFRSRPALSVNLLFFMRSKFFILLILVLIGTASYSQRWIYGMLDTSANFYKVQRDFNAYMDKRNDAGFIAPQDSIEEEDNFLQFKIWEEFTEPRVYPSGKIIDPSLIPANYSKYLTQQTPSGSASVKSSWSYKSAANKDGIGCLNFVRFHPSDSNIIFAGAASGGLWKSTDGGTIWTTNTDSLGTLNMSDLAFDPKNPSVIYLGTGGSGYTIGLLKSTNGGASWSQTGLINLKITSVAVNPDTPSIVLASSSNDVYRSVNGGVSFQKVMSGILMRNLMFKPGDPRTVYITAWNTFYRSVDGGVNFTAISSGLPPPGDLIRMSIATTPADPDYVYLLASSLSASDFYGLYLSTDAGLTFTLKSKTPNIVGGQGWFALAVAVSPSDKAEVVVGGLNIYRSANSGSTWTQISSWSVPSHTGKVHVDIHDLQYHNAATLFAATDGGLFKTSNNGSTWSNLCSYLQVAQCYSVGISQKNSALFIIGTQDNGTKTYNGAAWKQNIGGDGSVCFFDWSNDSNQYASLPQGQLAASFNNGTTFNYIMSGITESTNAFVIPWLQDPDSSNTLYAGFTNVWRSTNKGSAWTKISSFTGGGGVKAIAVCRGFNKCICAVTGNKLYRTMDGVNWINITGNLPVASASISDVVIKDADTNKIWVAFSGVIDGIKVFETSDGGKTWNNISGTLPNLPSTALVYQRSSPDALYLGMDIGVYYRDTILNSWELFNTGLPNAVIRQLKIQQASGKIVAATYGRGVWESDLFFNTSTTGVKTSAAYNLYVLKISPNPCDGKFDISFNGPSKKEDYRLEIRNASGQLLYEETLKEVSGPFSKQFDISKFGKGIYMLSLVSCSDKTLNSTQKIILN
jgi:hypothetical protein